MGHQTQLLVIDDDRNFVFAILKYFEGSPIAVEGAYSIEEGLSILRKRSVDVILLDQKLPDGDGHSAIREMLNLHVKAKIILCTAFPNFKIAVEAMKLGAVDYISKPVNMEELEFTVSKAVKMQELERIEQVLRYEQKLQKRATQFIGFDSGLASQRPHIDAAVGSDATVLITGDSGTGKSVLAKYIHFQSRRAKESFISINCSALSPSLIEAELFGYTKGAFTGAVKERRGLYELAHRGTLFLDEIGTMPMELQSKLLGVLEEGVIRSIGSERSKSVDVRIIAATNANVEQAIREKRFREDLFYRLNVIRLHMPALHERLEDLPELVMILLSKIGAPQTPMPSEAEFARLAAYSWPGNIRELRNILERAVLIQRGGPLEPSRFLPSEPTTEEVRVAGPAGARTVTLDELVKNHILTTYRAHGERVPQTARALHIPESTLRRKLKKLLES